MRESHEWNEDVTLELQVNETVIPYATSWLEEHLSAQNSWAKLHTFKF